MTRLTIAGFTGAGNVETFTVQEDDINYDLDANGVTRVDVYACDGVADLVSPGSRVISSDDNGDGITYLGSTLNIKFGGLGLQSGKYFVRVKIFAPTFPDGIVIVGPGLSMELYLKMNC